jgi:hypothetical protein
MIQFFLYQLSTYAYADTKIIIFFSEQRRQTYKQVQLCNLQNCDLRVFLKKWNLLECFPRQIERHVYRKNDNLKPAPTNPTNPQNTIQICPVLVATVDEGGDPKPVNKRKRRKARTFFAWWTEVVKLVPVPLRACLGRSDRGTSAAAHPVCWRRQRTGRRASCLGFCFGWPNKE